MIKKLASPVLTSLARDRQKNNFVSSLVSIEAHSENTKNSENTENTKITPISQNNNIAKKAKKAKTKPEIGNHDVFVEDAKKRFVECYKQSLNIAASCRYADIARTTYDRWMDKDEDFSFHVLIAKQEAVEKLYSIGYARATTGVRKPLVKHGQLVKDAEGELVYVQEYSNALLTLYLKAHYPDLFDRQAKTDTSDFNYNYNNNNNNQQIPHIPENFLVLDPQLLSPDTLLLLERDIKNFHDKQEGVIESDDVL